MKHFTISGRIPGDDEDTTLYVGEHHDRHTAVAEFEDTLFLSRNITAEERELLDAEYGQVTFLNAIITSNAPMEVF